MLILIKENVMSKNTQNYHTYPFTSESKMQESTQKLFSWIDEQRVLHNLCHRKCEETFLV